MKTEIGQINISLPAGLADRAAAIARRVGAALADLGELPAGRYDALDAGPLRVDAEQSDRAIAASIVGAIRLSIVARGAAGQAEVAPCSRR